LSLVELSLVSFYFLPLPPNCFFPLSFRQRIRANESGVAGGMQPANGCRRSCDRRRRRKFSDFAARPDRHFDLHLPRRGWALTPTAVVAAWRSSPTPTAVLPPAASAPPAGARRRSPGPRSPPVRSGPSSSCLRGCAAHRVNPVPRPCGPAVAAGCCPALGLTCAHGGPQRRRPPHRHGGLGGGGVAGGYGRPPGGATTLELVSATPTSLDCHPPRRYPAWPHPRRR